ncbi:MAG: DNA-processing protein DprA [Bacilli bacterium]|nr:DNA-processing protein DprA [Bacilli bacterium]
MEPKEVILAINYKYKGNFDAQMEAIRNMDADGIEDYYAEFLERNQASYTTLIDEDFPESYRGIARAPIVFHYHGNISLIYEKRRVVGIDCPKILSDYAAKMLDEIIPQLISEGYHIALVCAKGANMGVVRQVIDCGGYPIVFTPYGIDVSPLNEEIDTIEDVKKFGLFIGEIPGGYIKEAYLYPRVYELFAPCCRVLFFPQSVEKSFAGLLVDEASNNGNIAACLPYRADEESTNNVFIKDHGAQMVENAEDIIALLKS